MLRTILFLLDSLAGVCIYQNVGTSRPRGEAEAECVPSNGQSDKKVLYLHPNRQQIFACSTTSFFGDATIKWFGAAQSRGAATNYAEWHDLSNLTSIAELKRGGDNHASYIKTVSLRLPSLTKQQDRTNDLRLNMLQCRGYPSVDNFDSETVVLDQVWLKSYGMKSFSFCMCMIFIGKFFLLQQNLFIFASKQAHRFKIIFAKNLFRLLLRLFLNLGKDDELMVSNPIILCLLHP